MRGKYILMLILAAFALLTVLGCLVTIVEKSEPSTVLSASQAEVEASEDPVEVSTPETPSPSPSPISWSYTTPTPSPSSSPSPPPVSWSYTTPSLSPSAENSTSSEETSPSEEYVPYVSRGIWEDGIYKNDFSELQFTLPEGWEVLTDKEMAEYYEVSPEIYSSDESWQKEVQDGALLSDTTFVDPTNNNLITLMFGKFTDYDKRMDAVDEMYLEIDYAKLLKEVYCTFTYDDSFNNNPSSFHRAMHFHNDELEYSVYIFYKCKMNFIIASMIYIDDESGVTIDDIVAETELA